MLLSNLFSHGLLPSLQVVLAGILLLAEGGGFLLLLRTGASKPGVATRSVVTVLAVVSPLLILGLTLFTVHVGRETLIQLWREAGLFGAREPLGGVLGFGTHGLALVGVARLYGGVALTALGPLGAALVIVAWRRTSPQGQARRLAILIASGLGGSIFCLGSALWAYHTVLAKIIPVVAALDPHQKLFPLVAGIERANDLLTLLIYLSVLSVVLPAVIIILIAARNTPHARVSSIHIFISLVVLACGGISFAYTRGHAADSYISVPLAEHTRLRSFKDEIRLPRASRSTPVGSRWLPRMVIGSADPSSVVNFDGADVCSVGDLLEATGAQPLPRLLPLLREKQKIWREQDNEKHKEKPSPTALLFVERRLPARVLRPIFATFRAAGYHRVMLAIEQILPIHTSLLGTLQVPLNHGISVELSAVVFTNTLQFKRGETVKALINRIDQALTRGPVNLLVDQAVTETEPETTPEQSIHLGQIRATREFHRRLEDQLFRLDPGLLVPCFKVAMTQEDPPPKELTVRLEVNQDGKVKLPDQNKTAPTDQALVKCIGANLSSSDFPGGAPLSITVPIRVAASKLGKDQARGVLGLLRSASGADLAAIFGHEVALGLDAEDALGGLIGDQIEEAYGLNGQSPVSSGPGPLLSQRRKMGVRIKIGDVLIKGAMKSTEVSRIFRRHINEIRYCCELHAKKPPKAWGQLTTAFTVDERGVVPAVKVERSSVKLPVFERCVTRALSRWLFPAPEDSRPAQIKATISFTWKKK